MSKAKFRCYSDASVKHGVAAYGVVVAKKTGGKPKIDRKCGLLESRTTDVAELQAMAIGIEMVPEGESGVVFSDLQDIKRIISGEVSSERLIKHVARIRHLLASRRMDVRYAEKGNRSQHYHECHRLSRAMIRGKYRRVYCCECRDNVVARLTDGAEIYPNRPDLHHLPFWRCDTCENYTGCHYKTKDRTRPLGVIPSATIRKARLEIHALIDPIWKSGRMDRKEVYRRMSVATKRKPFHTSEIRTRDEAVVAWRAARELVAELR